MQKNKAYDLFIGMKQGTPSHGLPNDGGAVANSAAMQELTTAYITTMYFSALSNLCLQDALPDDMSQLDAEMPRLKIAFERTYADYMTAAKWLAEKGGEFIESSPARQYYDELLSMENEPVKDIPTFYATKNN